jgi:uncharacterized membrane protein
MTQAGENKLIVISFDDRIKAQEFLLTVARLQKQKELQLHDAVFLDRDNDGHTRVTETTDITPGRAALGGGVWGLLLGTLLAGPIGLAVGAAAAGGGALIAKLRDIGIKDEKIDELRREVPPGRTALALLISDISLPDLQRELVRFPNTTLVETDLTPDAVTAVQYALAEANRDPFSAAASASAPASPVPAPPAPPAPPVPAPPAAPTVVPDA